MDHYQGTYQQLLFNGSSEVVDIGLPKDLSIEKPNRYDLSTGHGGKLHHRWDPSECGVEDRARVEGVLPWQKKSPFFLG